MAHWLNRIHLRGKLAFILIAGFFLPMTILAAVTVDRLLTSNREVRYQEMHRSIAHICDQMDGYFSQAVALSLELMTDASLNSLLDSDYASPYDCLVAYQESIQPKMDVSPVFSAVSRVMVYTDNPTLLRGKYISSLETFDSIFESHINSVSLWSVSDQDLFLRVSDGGAQGLPEADVSLVRKMNVRPYDQHYRRILRVSMNLSVLEAELTGPEPFDSLMLVDEADHILVSSVSPGSAGSVLQFFDPGLIGRDRRTMELRLASCPSLRLVCVYPESAVTREFSQILSQYVVLSLLLGLLSLVLAALVTRNITRRLQAIGSHANSIAEGRFGVLDESRMGSDEVGLLASDINQMSRQLEAYIRKEYLSELRHAQLQREMATAELHALQSQVNPHFMFNALEAIRLKARARGETETARMITYMSRMFRRVLDWHDDLIPLEEELAFIQEFLAIQKYRYDHAFSFEVQTDEELLEVYIPKMLIQPLVENACVHGLWTGDDTRSAGLYITREGDRMRVVVADHGEGMSEERLSEVRQLLREGNNSMHSVGLNNVIVRSRLYYGDAAYMDVEPGENGGTVFTLVIPLRWKKEDFNVSGSDC